jgi:hypothetical protein
LRKRLLVVAVNTPSLSVVAEWEVLPTVLLLLEEVVCALGLAEEMVAVEVQASRATFRPRQDQLPLVAGALAMVLSEQEEFSQVSASGLVQVEEDGTAKSVVAVYTPSLLSAVGDAVHHDHPHQTGSVSAEVQASRATFRPRKEADPKMEGEEAESEKASPAGGLSGVDLQTFPVVATLGPGLASVAHLVEVQTVP